ncbi:phosphatase PAP2/dual specificity phosphatase family protein [Superficieibacter sp.]|uniref:phosphatase PAP2/dual specificity phosphatase family protein n=1 Tax=Superficieibacter sp. TaxID=2303322 RepID=UPI0028A7D69B|nr:phosphatase PAP2/dual specificity phosphatase family protein [Superficieibacter sp.]
MIARDRKILLQGVGWLALLGPFFFLTYGQVNVFTASRSDVGSMVFSWEHYIPFIPLSIIPYWSLDLLYGLSLFCCATLGEQRRLACRLLLASLLACLGFLLYPLRFTFTRPQVDGAAGWLFSQLEQFDLPYNQSPSLHIILCWIIWWHFHKRLSGGGQKLCDGWFLLIALSVVTTWQHHVIDILSGLAVGMLISWIVPDQGTWRWRRADSGRKTLALRYFVGALVCLITPWLWWPALSLLIVALGYAGLGVAAMQKNASGRITPAAYWLLLPWRLGTQLSARWFTRHLAPVTLVVDGVYLGCYPRAATDQHAVLDLTCEFPRPASSVRQYYACVPMLDLVVPESAQLAQAVELLEQLRTGHGSVLVHCSLGLSRSALVVAAWLLHYGHVQTVDEAVVLLRARRQQVVLKPFHLETLQQWQKIVTT